MKIFAILTAVLLLVGMVGCAASTAGTQSHKLLTVEEGQNIALEHAGFTAEQVAGLRTDYELDDVVRQYEVEFRQGDYEYDYTIHAETGAILEWDKDYEAPADKILEWEKDRD